MDLRAMRVVERQRVEETLRAEGRIHIGLTLPKRKRTTKDLARIAAAKRTAERAQSERKKPAYRVKKRVRLFTDSVLGDLHKVCYNAINRHCRNYGLKIDMQITADAAQEAITECLELEILRHEDIEERKLAFIQVIALSRKTVNAYRRELHKTNAEEFISTVLDEGEERSVLIEGHYPSPGRALEVRDMMDDLRDTLHFIPGGYEVILGLAYGLTQKEVAENLRVARKTVARRVGYVQDKLTTGYIWSLTR